VYSPDGTRIAAIANEGAAGRVLLLAADGSGHPLALRAPAPLHRPSFSPDGTRLAAMSDSGVAYLFALATGQVSALAPAAPRGPGRLSREGAFVAFSPDGQRLALAQPDLTLELRSLVASDAPVVLRGNTGNLQHVSFTSDGRRVLTTSGDGAFRIWDARSGTPLQVGRTDGSHAVFDRDGEQLASLAGSEARVVSLLQKRKPIVLRARASPMVSAAFDAAGARLSTISVDGTARVWTLDWSRLISGLRRRTTACLSSQQRADLLGESASRAAQAADACERSFER
jgi:WD40 repeat protein